MSNRRGNQTGYEPDLSPEEGTETIGDLFNPGHAASGNEPRDGLVSFDADQDISQAAKVTLGKYLGASSRGQVGNGRPNLFQLRDGSTAGSTSTVSDNNSTRQSPGTTRSDIEGSGATLGTFLDLAKGYDPAARGFESTKHSEYSRSGDNPFQDPDINIKNYSDPDKRARGQDGNSLLLNIKSRSDGGSATLGSPQIGPLPNDAPVVQKKISDVLRQNRFNPLEKAFVENGTWRGTGATLQRKLGVHEKDNGKEIQQGLLEQVGLKLMIRATGHSVPGLDLLDSSNNLQLTNNLAPLIPSAPQLTGLPLIDIVNLRAGNVAIAEDILGVGVTPESARAEYINGVEFDARDGSIGSQEGEVFAGKSYGVLNSHIEPFGGPLPIGTFTTTVAGIIAIVGASSLVALLPMLLGGERKGKPRKSTFNADPATLTKGKRAFFNSEADGYSNDNVQEYVLSLLGIPKTDHNWGQCLLVGIGSFFGIDLQRDDTGNVKVDTDSILSSLFDLVTAPGYYAVIIRNTIRDTEQIVRGIEEFAQSAGDVNVVKSISGIFKIVESITTSALYRFMMAMTALGNQILNYRPTETNLPDTLSAVDLGALRHRSRFSDNPTPATLPALSSNGNGDLGRNSSSALTWKHSAPQSNYILPGTFITSLNRSFWIDSDKRGSDKIVFSKRFRKAIGSTGRLPPDSVKKIENELEGEYVPFYFQDLRTNEVISFHAFLSSLSDGFTANYNSTTGYGRADEVMIYNNTKRAISFEFHIVATSVEDLNVMYWNINKLISMLYPQYSKGRVMVNGGTKFIQPFSQIPTASPMIRLRIGDIIRGNYSKFGLARLFGLGGDTNSFNFKDEANKQLQARRDAARPSALSRARRELMSPSRQKKVGDKVLLSRILRNFNIWCKEDGRGTETVEDIITTSTGAELGMAVFASDIPAPLRNWLESGSSLARGVPAESEVEIVEVRPSPLESLMIQATGGSVSNSLSRPDPAVALDPEQNQYMVKMIAFAQDRETGFEGNLSAGLGEYLYFYVYENEVTGYSSSAIEQRANEILDEEVGAAVTESGIENAIRDFFSGEEGKNPIVRAFESTRGRGLAGFITDLKMDWAEATWEIDPGMRAPKSMKLSVSFAPIHDLPMGLDADGMMSSVAYNVGSMSRHVGRDQYEDSPTPPEDTTSGT